VDVMRHFEKIIQSNAEFMLKGQITVTALVSELPQGGRVGQGHLNKAQYNTSDSTFFARNKKSIVLIQNLDNICLARAIVVGKAYADQEEGFRQTRKPDRQKKKALALCKNAGVDPLVQAGLPEAHKFQSFLKEYRLTIFGSRNGKTILFDGNVQSQKYIDILYDTASKHFNTIVNIAGAFNVKDYCRDCKVGTDLVNSHTCKTKCRMCRSLTGCPLSGAVVVSCDDYGKDFFPKRALMRTSHSYSGKGVLFATAISAALSATDGTVRFTGRKTTLTAARSAFARCAMFSFYHTTFAT